MNKSNALPLKKIKYSDLVWQESQGTSTESTQEEKKVFPEIEKLLDQQPSSAFNLSEGEIIQGTVTKITRDFVTVDIGHKSTGNINLSEFKRSKNSLKIGDQVQVYLDSFEDDEGALALSKEKADQIKAWKSISEAYENGSTVKGLVLGRIKGGLSVEIGVRAFLPGSQIDLRPTRNLDKWVGKELDFKIIKFNRRRNNIVLSRRALLEAQRAEQRDETLRILEVDQIVSGTVKNITDYGAFIDLGGIDGLLHVTDMTWGRRVNPNEIVKVGEKIEVKVLSFEQEKMKVSLGLRQMTPDPWENIEQRYTEGQKLTGKVVSLVDYGAFVEVESGIEGLIHVTEMSWSRRIKHPSQLVTIDDEIEVIVLGVEKENRRISLGIKQTDVNPWEKITEKYQVGDVIRAHISNVTEFGVFVAIEEGVDGLIHVSDLSWTERVEKPQDLYKRGDEIEAKVLKIDVNNRRFSLGVKQLDADPYFAFANQCKPGTKIKAKIVKIVDFGCFLELAKGVEGLVHNSELIEDIKTLKVGDELECILLNSNPEEHRLELSQKAAAEWSSEYKKIVENAQIESRTEMSHAFLEAKKKKS